MTLRELLKQNELRVVEVAAGADGLARTISGAVMFDNPEMVNWMRAGEIMLTTGYFLLDDPVKQEKVLRDLADSGSGGLVIKMKRYFHEIPPAMLQLADELHFPLMRIPYHTSLSEISEAVSKYVYGINEEQALQMVYQAMFDVLQGHAEVEYLLKKCGPLLHVPLLYMTPSRKIQCVSQMLQPGLREELAVGQVLFSVPERVKEVEKLRTAGLSAGIYPLQQEDKCVHIYPIHSEQEIMGYLGAIRPANAPLTENENTLYRRIAAACTLVLIKKRGGSSSRREISHFLDGLVTEGALSYGEIVKSANYCNIPLYSPYICALISFTEQNRLLQTSEWLGTSALLRSQLADKWEMLSGNISYAFAKYNNVILVLQQSESLSVYEQVALVREYCGDLMKMLSAKGQDRGVIFGIGDPVPSLAEFCRSYSQALRTVDLASRICDERIATYRRYILCELIYDSPNAKLALIQRIKPLLAYDEEHNTQLLYTLETYFNNCQNSVKTSKALFIHRNTLLYRLDRIAEILDLNYNDSEQMLTFQLALKAFLMCQ